MIASAWGIIVASGKAEEFAPDIDTAFLNLGSRPLLVYALSAFEQCHDIEGVIVVAPKDRIESVRGMVQMFGCHKVKKVVAGTTQRQTSVLNGLKALDDEVPVVTIHDGSRPCVTAAQISETIKAAKRYGSGVLASRITESVKVAAKGTTVTEDLNSSVLWATHTPQSFKSELIVKGMESAQKKKKSLSDDSEALTFMNEEVHLVPTDQPTLKVNKALELNLAEFLLRR